MTADHRVTEALVGAYSAIGIAVQGHLIVAGEEWYSFAKAGDLPVTGPGGDRVREPDRGSEVLAATGRGTLKAAVDLGEQEVKAVCEARGVSSRGRRVALIDALLGPEGARGQGEPAKSRSQGERGVGEKRHLRRRAETEPGSDEGPTR